MEIRSRDIWVSTCFTMNKIRQLLPYILVKTGGIEEKSTGEPD